MASSAVKARLKALRKRFHLGEFSHKAARKHYSSAPKKRARTGVVSMSRHRRSRSRGGFRRGFGSMNSIVKDVVVGLAIGFGAQKLGQSQLVGAGAAGASGLVSLPVVGRGNPVVRAVAAYFEPQAMNILGGVAGAASGGTNGDPW